MDYFSNLGLTSKNREVAKNALQKKKRMWFRDNFNNARVQTRK